jgi:hypothetical protein
MNSTSAFLLALCFPSLCVDLWRSRYSRKVYAVRSISVGHLLNSKFNRDNNKKGQKSIYIIYINKNIKQ